VSKLPKFCGGCYFQNRHTTLNCDNTRNANENITRAKKKTAMYDYMVSTTLHSEGTILYSVSITLHSVSTRSYYEHTALYNVSTTSLHHIVKTLHHNFE
jgi:hypothetical protein